MICGHPNCEATAVVVTLRGPRCRHHEFYVGVRVTEDAEARRERDRRYQEERKTRIHRGRRSPGMFAFIMYCEKCGTPMPEEKPCAHQNS